LDTYFCGLNANYFSKIIKPGDYVRFQYHFHSLLRGLLKIVYNVARARNWPQENWKEISQYILGETQNRSGFRVFVQLLIPTPANKTDLPVSPGTKEIPPLAANAYLCDVSNLPGLKSAYWMSVWSYRFFLLQEDEKSPVDTRKRTVRKWLKSTTGAYELKDRKLVKLFASSVDVLAAVKNSRAFQDQLSKARTLHSERSRRNRTRSRDPLL